MMGNKTFIVVRPNSGKTRQRQFAVCHKVCPQCRAKEMQTGTRLSPADCFRGPRGALWNSYMKYLTYAKYLFQGKQEPVPPGS